MQLKMLKFTLNFKLLVHYMFRPICSSSGASKLMLETAALPPMHTIRNFTLVYGPMCCTSVTHNSNCIIISRVEYIDVSYSVAGCVLICSAAWLLLRVAVTSVHEVESFLRKVDGVYAAI
jgi:hypothetical protein